MIERLLDSVILIDHFNGVQAADRAAALRREHRWKLPAQR